jgi:hypothetical protein
MHITKQGLVPMGDRAFCSYVHRGGQKMSLFIVIDNFARNAYENATSAGMLEQFVTDNLRNQGGAYEVKHAVREA